MIYFREKKNDYGNRIIREKTISYQQKKNVLTQKKKSTEKIIKKTKKKERKGKKENKIEYKYSISFKALYCNLTAI